MSSEFSREFLDSAWADVREHRPVSRELSAFELELAVAGGRTMLAVGEDGFRRILFPLNPGGPCKEDRRSAGVSVGRSELIDKGVRVQFVEVACRHPSLNDIFSSIASEILAQISEDPTRPDLKAGSVLNRWRSLLRPPARPGLDLNATVGLLGELVVLEMLAESGHADVEAWTGPDMFRHDVTLQRGSIEVKSTTAANGWRIEIHGTRQLELPPSGNLILGAVRFERSPQGKRYLENQIERLVNLGVDAEVLWAKLNLLGVYEESQPGLTEHRFDFREAVAFIVDNDFPKITQTALVSGALPEEIVDLRYTLDITGLRNSDLQEALIPLVVSKEGA